MGQNAHAGSEHAPRHEGRSGVRGFISDAWAGLRFARQAREARAATSTVRDPEQWLLHALQGAPTKSGASVNENTAFNVSAIRACVNIRANMLAMLPLKVYLKTDLGSKEQRDHPLAKLLRGRVSGAQTRFKWIHSSSICHDIGGNAYSRIFRNAYSEIQRIQWERPCDVIPLYNRATGETGFRVAGSGDLQSWEVLHIANLSTNGVVGRSPLADLREAVGLALTAEEFTARTFANGNRKPGVLEGGKDMNKTRAEEFQQFWMQHYAGAQNAGKSPFIFGGVQWKDAGFSNDEAQLLGTRKFTIEEIGRVYHLPLHLIGSTEKSTTWGSGIAEMNQALVDYTLQPLCTNWEDEMKTTLLTEREQDDGYFIKFNVDALLRGSPETRAAFYQAMRAIRAISVNDIRRQEDLMEAPDAGANNLDWPMNNQGGGGQPVAPKKNNVPAGDIPAE